MVHAKEKGGDTRKLRRLLHRDVQGNDVSGPSDSPSSPLWHALVELTGYDLPPLLSLLNCLRSAVHQKNKWHGMMNYQFVLIYLISKWHGMEQNSQCNLIGFTSL
jgi:hypothetical protein